MSAGKAGAPAQLDNSELPSAGMDPSTIKQWEWSARTPGSSRQSAACVLWTLHLDGPFESTSGNAIQALTDALVARDGPYAGRAGESSVHVIVKQLAVKGLYAGAVQREVRGRKCYKLSTPLGPDQLPDNPYAKRRGRPPKPATEPSDRPAKPRKAAAVNGHDPQHAVDARDALLVIGGLVDEVLGHRMTAAQFATAERLAEALAEAERLRAENMKLETALLDRLKEIDTLRRALASARRVRV